MLLLLLGYRYLDFVSNNGSQVKGTQLFVAFPEDGITGRMCDKLFIHDGMELPTLSPGMTLEVAFNRKGKVVAVKAASAPAVKE